MDYENPPITEAIFDVQVDKLNNGTLESLEKAHEDLKNEYPDKEKKINYSEQVELREPDRESDEQSNIVGYLFSNEAGNRKVQFRLDGFTYNVLAPYENWEKHSREFFRLWQQFEKRFAPHEITRIGVRYINRIDIPINGENFDFDDYIKNMPPTPGCLPDSIGNFFMQVQAPTHDPWKNVVITQTMEPPEGETLPFILDINVIQIEEISRNAAGLKEQLEAMRSIKNEVFEDCITEKTRKLFNL